MKPNVLILASLLGLLCLLTLPAFAAPPVTCLSVTDFGATPNDPKDDDAIGIEAAITAACAGDTPCRAVYFPGGEYHIKTTINVSYTSYCVKLFGTGIRRAGWRPEEYRPTQINWIGPADGTMVEVKGVSGFRVEDISFNGDYKFDGVDKAKIGIDVCYEPGSPSAEFNFERMEIMRCGTGFVCEKAGGCNSDMTFIDFVLSQNNIGFHTCGGQNVNYIFTRPEVVYDQTTPNTLGYWFEEGSSVAMTGFCSGALTKVMKIDSGGINGGCFVFNEWKPELYDVANERPVLLDVGGHATTVYISGLCTGWRPAPDTARELINMRWNALVKITASQLYMTKLAKVGDGTGNALLILDACRFGGSDPRAEGMITHDDHSGFVLRDCEAMGAVINARYDQAMPVLPVPPSALVATASKKQVTLTWKDNSDNEERFCISRLNNGSWQEIGATNGANIITFTDPNVTAGATYMYKVCAMAGTTRGAYCKEASVTPAE